MERNHELGMKKKEFETVINNAPDPLIFNTEDKVSFSNDRKIRLIATSWSSNWNKGFEAYKWLDENLDFQKYEMIFIGNTPIKFKNIKHLSPISTNEIAVKLKASNIFILASRFEACSNSLLEALHCGLPVVGANGSSSPELIGNGGETFNTPEQIPPLLEKIMNNYYEYQSCIKVSPIDEIGKKYYDFISQVCDRIKTGQQEIKPLGFKDYITVKTRIAYSKISGRAMRFFEKS